MLARWLGLAAVTVAAFAASGCAGPTNASEAPGNQLTVYSSLPLQGPSAEASRQIVEGEKLALSQAGGHVGRFKVSYSLLDDVDPTSGQPSPSATSTAAKTAAQDPSTIAYLGDLGSAATALSLPLTNAAGILQVSPGSPYVGLTSALDAGQDEPNRFYPTGKRSFGRVLAGDPVQAAAQVALMRRLGVKRVYVIDDEDPFEIPLATLAASDATQAGIAVLAHDSVQPATGSTYAGEVEKVVGSGAQAVLFVGGGGAGAVSLWQALHGAAPHLALLGTSAMLTPEFVAGVGAAAAQTYLTTPLLAPSLYPPAARRVLAQAQRAFGGETGPYVLYGYETMSAVLAAIRAAGARGNDRQAVIERFFMLRERDSVLGRYSMQSSGETTLARYGYDRMRAGRAVFAGELGLAGIGAGAGG